MFSKNTCHGRAEERRVGKVLSWHGSPRSRLTSEPGFKIFYCTAQKLRMKNLLFLVSKVQNLLLYSSKAQDEKSIFLGLKSSGWKRWWFINSQVLYKERRLQGKRLNELQPMFATIKFISSTTSIALISTNLFFLSNQYFCWKCDFYLCPQFQSLGCHPFRLSTSGKDCLLLAKKHLEYINPALFLVSMKWKSGLNTISMTLETLFLFSWRDDWLAVSRFLNMVW